MREIHMEFDEVDDIIQLLLGFIDDVYTYLDIEIPEDFDPDEELIRVVQAIKDKCDAVQKP
jgi:hypothetical protein